MRPDDDRLMAAALALSQRAVGRTAANPPVGCIIIRDGRVIARGWTQPGGRPHAEAMALSQADARGAAANARGATADARGATAYVTLEPCAHASPRGPTCTDSLIAARLARVVIAATDPDPRTNGAGIAALHAAGIAVTENIRTAEARAIMAGFFTRQARRRPHITLKLAVSLDGSIALGTGESRWITGERARAHAHLERARADLILVGRGTLDADNPRLSVRLPGLEARSPAMAVMSAARDGLGDLPPGVHHFAGPDALAAFTDGDLVLAEGGAGLASSLIAADMVDRLLLYRAPILLAGRPALAAIGLASLAAAHGRWAPGPVIDLAPDRLETYTRIR